MGNVDVAIVDPHGHKDAVRPMVSKKNEVTWYVEYTPLEEGLHSVNVFFSGQAIPNSPYGVGVAPGQCPQRQTKLLSNKKNVQKQTTPASTL